MDISVVIPVYGCKAALPELHRRLTESLTKITENYEIILVNDGCPQNSWEEIEKICAEDEKVVGIELSRNFGQIKALMAGLDYSTGDWVIVMDCDLQDRPEEIINLYNKAQEGYDVVFARRKERKDSKFKVFLSNCFYKFYSFAADIKYDPALCNFSISSRKVIDGYCSMRELHRAFVIYVKWMGFKQTAIDIEHDERFEGESGYNFKKRMKMAGDIIFSQSDKILKLMVKIGAVVSIVAFIAIIYLLIHGLVTQVLPGWSSLMVSMFFLGGIVIMAVGIVGIYVGNIFMQVKNRPLYFVRTLLNPHKEEGEEKEK